MNYRLCVKKKEESSDECAKKQLSNTRSITSSFCGLLTIYSENIARPSLLKQGETHGLTQSLQWNFISDHHGSVLLRRLEKYPARPKSEGGDQVTADFLNRVVYPRAIVA